MRILTKGKTRKLCRKELRYAARYMASLIMSKQLLKHVSIHIKCTPTIMENGNELKAYMSPLGKKPLRRFEVVIATSKSKREQLLALAHELVHCKQFAKGEMTENVKGIVKWKRETIDQKKVTYFWLPWELESFGYEKALYYSYKDHLEDKGIKWGR